MKVADVRVREHADLVAGEVDVRGVRRGHGPVRVGGQARALMQISVSDRNDPHPFLGIRPCFRARFRLYPSITEITQSNCH